MNKKTDEILINEIKKGINVSKNFEEISKRHSALFFKMTSKYIANFMKERKIEFLKDKDSFIFKTILDFKNGKNSKFSTYLANRVKWACINNYNNLKKFKNIQLNENLKITCDENFLSKYNIDYKECINFLKSKGDKRTYEIFKLRYLEGKKNKLMPWKEVSQSKNVNLSIQGCINIHNNFIKQLKTIK